MPRAADRAAKDERIEVSIVTVLYQSGAVLPGFLDSLPDALADVSAEVILVDHGSSDGSLEGLGDREGITVVVPGRNGGYAAGMNRGIERAQGRTLLLCNPDIVLRPGAIPTMLAALDGAEEIGGVSPVIEVPAPATFREGGDDATRIYPLLRGDPGALYGWCFFSGIQDRFAGSALLNPHLERAPQRSAGDLPWIHGCCGLFRSAAIREVGGLDEGFFLYFEDADLGRRLRAAGWRMVLAPGARVLHLEGQSSRDIPLAVRRWFVESYTRYQRRHSSLPGRVLGWSAASAGMALQLAVQMGKALCGRDHRLRLAAATIGAHLAIAGRSLSRAPRGRAARVGEETPAPAR